MSLSTQDIEMVKQLARLECEDLRKQLDADFSEQLSTLHHRCDVLGRNNRTMWAMLNALKEQLSGSMERWKSEDFEIRFKERVQFLITARLAEDRAQAEKTLSEAQSRARMEGLCVPS